MSESGAGIISSTSADDWRAAYRTPIGRRRAWRELLIDDHGALRALYDNTHEIAPGRLWRTFQPSPAHLEKWAARGARTVVNLRGDRPSGFLFLEEEACERLGLRLVTFQAFSREAPSASVITGAQALFASIEYPAVIHCKSGADRAGLLATLYLFLHEGRPLDEALGQLSWRYGHVRQGKTGVIDAAFDLYLRTAAAAGWRLDDPQAFLRWVEEDYDPAAVKRAYLGSWWGNFLTERVLRRE